MQTYGSYVTQTKYIRGKKQARSGTWQFLSEDKSAGSNGLVFLGNILVKSNRLKCLHRNYYSRTSWKLQDVLHNLSSLSKMSSLLSNENLKNSPSTAYKAIVNLGIFTSQTRTPRSFPSVRFTDHIFFFKFVQKLMDKWFTTFKGITPLNCTGWNF